jgi:methylated-DNA-[protein]-cysteine S-methyltransferase
MMIHTCIIETPLGQVRAAAQTDAVGTFLTGLWFLGQKYAPSAEGWLEAPGREPFSALRAWLDDYFAGRCPPAPPQAAFPFLVEKRGTPFQVKIWKELENIPYGETLSYGELAARAGSHARAVGGAVGRNPVSILVPCHRVTGVRGELTGYAGGLERKAALLTWEQRGVPSW